MTVQSQTETRREQTRELILNTAADVFARVGFAGARVDEIARQAGVNKAMIYYHIGDKHTLYTEVLIDKFNQIATRMAENIKQDRSPEDNLSAYIHSLLETAEKNQHMAPIMMREVASGGQYLPEVVIGQIKKMLEILVDIIESGVRQKVFIETAPLLVHFMVMGTFTFYKTSRPLVAAHLDKNDAFRKRLLPDTYDAGAGEIEKLVLRAIKVT